MKLIILFCLLCCPLMAAERYVVTIQIRQSNISLDVWKHIKNHANALTIEVPVDKQFYDDVHVGQRLNEKFRTASLIISGSWGNWLVTVTNKRHIP